MIKRFIFGAVLAFAALFGTACSDRHAEELFDTARLEERQNSPDHARQLYRELIEKYPDSTWAEEARNRLEGLSGGNTE